MISAYTKTESVQLIQGSAGQLEIAISQQSDNWAVICHPHPLFGGAMTNKVVTTLVKTFQGLGFSTIRFNFRGVGQSEGVFDNGDGEFADLQCVIDWLKQEYAVSLLTLAGFSFGAYIAARGAIANSVNGLVTIAPPVLNFPMKTLPEIQCPWLIVQGDQDEVVAAEAVYAFAEQRNPAPTIIRFAEATHFFHGKLTELQMELTKALRTLLSLQD